MSFLSVPVAAALLLSGVHAAKFYTNPVLNVNFPDPAVLRLPDGTFAAFATNNESSTGVMTHIQCATSPDLVSWTLRPDALPALPSWASTLRSCAPDVQLHAGVYYMYFLAYAHDNKTNCIGVATSSVATGPYSAPASTPIVCDGNGATAMDARSFDAPDGSIWLYYGSHTNPITAARLDPSRLTLAQGATPTPVLFTDASSYGTLVEGPWVYQDATGALTMLYSGSRCCGTSAHYAVMAARSPSGSPTGPWVKLGGASGNGSVILASDATGMHVTAPGHNAVVRDDAGVDWLLYHGNAGPQCNTNAGCPRVLFLDRLYYNATWNGSDTWPWTSGPSYTSMPAPTITQRV